MHPSGDILQWILEGGTLFAAVRNLPPVTSSLIAQVVLARDLQIVCLLDYVSHERELGAQDIFRLYESQVGRLLQAHEYVAEEQTQTQGRSVELVTKVVGRELARTNQTGVVFRGNSLATKVTSSHPHVPSHNTHATR